MHGGWRKGRPCSEGEALQGGAVMARKKMRGALSRNTPRTQMVSPRPQLAINTQSTRNQVIRVDHLPTSSHGAVLGSGTTP